MNSNIFSKAVMLSSDRGAKVQTTKRLQRSYKERKLYIKNHLLARCNIFWA